MIYLKAFVAGFASTLAFHQGLPWLLYTGGFSPRAPWNMTPVPPLNAPAVISLAFWGGVWGIALWALIRASRGGAYWTKALVIGALGPSLVAWFVVMPIKGMGLAGGWDPKIIVSALLLNGAWGLGVALLMRLLNRVSPVVSYKKEARTLRIWDGNQCQQPITWEVFAGAFTGANGNTIHWEAVSRMGNHWPPAHLNTTYTFTVDASTPGPIGPLRVYQYLDGDIGDHNSNVFGTIMNASPARIATFDAIERFGVAQVGGFPPSTGDDASFAGLAADSFDLIRERIMGSGQPVAQTSSGITHAEINLPLIDDFAFFTDFTYYGPGNIVSVLAWDINPDIDDRVEITSSLVEIGPLVPHHPGATPAREQFSCQLSGCVVPVTCSLLARCDAKVEIFVGTAAYPFNSAVASEKFAVASATIQPDATVRVRPKLTKRGKSILRKKRNKKVRGLMEIRNASTGILFSSTPVRIKLK